MQNKTSFINAMSMVLDDKKEIIVSLAGAIATLFMNPPRIVMWIQRATILGIATLLIFAMKDMWNIIRKKHIPIIIDVGDDIEYVDSMRKTVYAHMRRCKFNPHIYFRQLKIKEQYITIHEDDYLSSHTKDWFGIVEEYTEHLHYFNTNLEGLRNFHIFMKCPVALTVGLGAVTGTNNAVALYHHSDGHYKRVINLLNDEKTAPMGTHILKNRVTQPFEYIEVNEPKKKTSHLFISLGLASHPPLSDVIRLAESKSVDILNITNKYNSTLSTDKDWLLAAREVLTEIMRWISEKNVTKVVLCISAPLPLAFAIGMGLGRQSPITVCQWFAKESKYYPVLELNKL